MSALRDHGDDRLLSPQEAGEMVGVSAWTMRLWARERRVPALRLGKYWRFRHSSLVAWIVEQERAAR